MKGTIEELIQKGWFYASSQWKKTRLEVLKRDKFKCQRCKEKGVLSKSKLCTPHRRIKTKAGLSVGYG